MSKDGSAWARALAAAAIGFVLVVASTTVFAWFVGGSVRVRPLLPLVVWAGFNLPLIPGGLVVLLVGYLADLSSGGMVGFQISSLMVVFLVASLAAARLEISAVPLQIAAVFFLSFVFQLVFWGGLTLAPRLHIQPPDFPWVILPQAVTDALTAPFFILVVSFASRLSERVWARIDTRGQRRRA